MQKNASGQKILRCGLDLPICDAQLLLKGTERAPEALVRAHNAPALLAVGTCPAVCSEECGLPAPSAQWISMMPRHSSWQNGEVVRCRSSSGVLTCVQAR